MALEEEREEHHVLPLMEPLKKEKEEHHVLMVAFSAQGHINPMLRLAKRLLSKGLHVTLATTEIARQRMLSSSATTTTAMADNSIAGISLAFFSDGLSLDYDRKTNLDHYMDTLAKFGHINLSTIIHNHTQSHGRKFSCIINNPFVPWVADVAAEHEIPCAMLWIQPCTLYSIYYRFYNNLNQFPTLTNPDMSIELPGLPLLHTQDLPSFVLPSNPLSTFPKLFTELFQNMKKLKWVLANSFYELEKDVIESMSELCPIKPIGPLVPSTLLGEDEETDAGIEMWKSEDSCIEWLNQQEPKSVIYVSFGSIVVLSAKQMESIAIGLMNTKRPFLWVVKASDYQVKDGDGQFPLGFNEETKDRGLIVSWSPQIKVLSHPSVACFLSHCGWNSMLETITAGVPVIAYPQWTDQPTNAKFISDVLRIGVRLRPNQDEGVTDEEVTKCIEKIMVGPSSEEFKKNMAELKMAAREAVASGGSTDRNIQWFVDEIIGSQGTLIS
ncbi:UDP-glycosyltransferase 84B2-like [Cornus florida]|uniref:UDP-glycosyltransferase 84B2-like n=1 Tax=Cornus florida TaxID=4283 RepID=UPI00289B798E|nr:UDP-glycosyltransferase 84B2-like [Cornus florida]